MILHCFRARARAKIQSKIFFRGSLREAYRHVEELKRCRLIRLRTVGDVSTRRFRRFCTLAQKGASELQSETHLCVCENTHMCVRGNTHVCVQGTHMCMWARTHIYVCDTNAVEIYAKNALE